MTVSQPVRYGILLLVSLLAAGMLLLGVRQYQADRRAVEFVAQAAKPVSTPKAEAGAKTEPAAKPEPALLVHVTGAVAVPGVYRLDAGARVADAIAAAGGALPGGMADALNLADRLRDGDKLYVPTIQEMRPETEPVTTDPGHGTSGYPVAPITAPAAQGATKSPVQATRPVNGGAGTETNGKVNINTATAKQLEDVPGIGPVMAGRIVEYRTKNGPFQRLEDLDAVTGIGPSTLQKLLPSLTL